MSQTIIYLSFFLSFHSSINISIYLSTYISIFTFLFIFMPTYISIYLSMSTHNLEKIFDISLAEVHFAWSRGDMLQLLTQAALMAEVTPLCTLT